MATLIFATSNTNKLIEAKEILNYDVVGTELVIPEVQSLDTSHVARQKTLAYFAHLHSPLFVEDVSLTFDTLGKLPGTYIADFLESLGNEGLLKLVAHSKDRGAIARTTLVYVNESGKTFEFIGEVKGSINTVPRGNNGFGWDQIFVPEGSEKTFAEMDLKEKNIFSIRRLGLEKMADWLRIHR